MHWVETVSLFTYTLSRLIPKKKNRWIFGAWFGSAISDNTKSLYDYLHQTRPDIEKIWIVNDPTAVQLDGCKLIRRNSLQSLRYILTARVAVMNQGFGDFCAVNLLGGCFKVQLWHGIAWKKIARDAVPELTGLKGRIFDYVNRYDLYIAPSEPYRDTVVSAFGAKRENVLPCGQPRNELLFDSDFRARSRQRLIEATGIPADKTIIVYMPTFRDTSDEVFSFCREDILPEIDRIVGQYNCVIIEKSHYKSYERRPSYEAKSKQCVFTLPTMDAQTLLGGADMLITDYSSCFFDYLICDKPIIHYAYDYEYYKNKDRGLYYPIEEVAAGSVAADNDALFAAIEENLRDPGTQADRRRAVREKYVTYEKPGSCQSITEQIVRRIRLG